MIFSFIPIVFSELYDRSMFYSISRILFNDPPKKILTLETQPLISINPDPIDLIPKLNSYLANKNSYESPLFIVGTWGSGKTHRVLNFKKQNNKKYSFRYRSFFSINNLEEAYSNLIGKTQKLITFLGLFLMNLYLFLTRNNEHNFLLLISIVVSYGFFINKLKLFYVFFNLIDSINPKTKVTIIDDLDRSSLSESDQWAMLSNLWHFNHRYIVLLGYVDSNEKGTIIERAEKLHGDVIFLPNNEKINFNLASEKDKDFKKTFDEKSKQIDWLNYISPRDLMRIVSEVKTESEDMEWIFKTFLYLTKFIEQISYNLKLDFFDRENIYFGGVRNADMDARSPGHIEMLRFITKTEKSPPIAREKIRDVYDSLTEGQKEAIRSFKDNWLKIPKTAETDFPTVFRYEMSKYALINLYKFKLKNNDA